MTPEAPPTASVRREARWEQTAEGFGAFRIVPVDPAADAGLIHSWVTEERARFWGMLDASRTRVQEIYDHLDGLATHHAYLVHRDDRPVALFQTYDPGADPVGECYDVQPGDFGVHLLLGPATGRASAASPPPCCPCSSRTCSPTHAAPGSWPSRTSATTG
ncbi:hypothetical protein GCM10027612_08240 [Microbispora bryophytorum subsp. camponoti]